MNDQLPWEVHFYFGHEGNRFIGIFWICPSEADAIELIEDLAKNCGPDYIYRLRKNDLNPFDYSVNMSQVWFVSKLPVMPKKPPSE